MPRNRTVSSPAIHSRVTAALRDSGLRKAGTPLEMASTPVMAVQPPEKAASNNNRPTPCGSYPSADLGVPPSGAATLPPARK